MSELWMGALPYTSRDCCFPVWTAWWVSRLEVRGKCLRKEILSLICVSALGMMGAMEGGGYPGPALLITSAVVGSFDCLCPLLLHYVSHSSQRC